MDGWQSLRESGFRIFFVGLFSLVIAFIIYARLTAPSSSPVMVTPELANLAYGILAITAACMASMIYGAYAIFRSVQLKSAGSNGLVSYITGAFADRKYWRIMAAAAIGYGILYGMLTQILVYRADVAFSEQGIAVPSVSIIPCCGAPGYVPMLTAYLTDHFLVSVIPLNVVLAAAVSLLVGFNVALSVYAFKIRSAAQKKTSMVGGMGAAAGLFVGCPTCTGSLISISLGIGTTATASLAAFQTLFIALSIPALIAAPFLIARGLRSISSCRLA